MILEEHTLANVTVVLDKLHTCCMNAVQDGYSDGEAEYYKASREWLRQNRAVFDRCPALLKECRNLLSVRTYSQRLFDSWAERRDYLDREFEDSTDQISNLLQDPLSDVDHWLVELHSESARDFWEKTKLRIRLRDYDGAITASKSFLEVAIKELLNQAGKPASGDESLPQLWRDIGDELNLLPNAHDEQIYKQILGNMQSVVSGIANIRNTQGDAHGAVTSFRKPAQRHAELVVNLSAAMVQYLIEAWVANSDSRS